MKTTLVYFSGETLEYGAYVSGARVELPEDYTMLQLVNAIRSRGFRSFMTMEMRTLVTIV